METLRLVLVSTAAGGLDPLGTLALEAWVRAHPVLGERVHTTRVEVPYPTPWWHAPPFDDAVLDAVLAAEPDVLGLSLMVWDLAAQLDLAARVRAARPEVRIVAGGPSATSAGVGLIEEHPVVDAVVAGEGEAPLAALLVSALAGEPPAAFPGLSWRGGDGRLRDGGPPGEPVPMDALPSPLAEGLYRPEWLATLELARGCPHRCRFCAWSRSRGGWRTAGAERMGAEIAALAGLEVATAVLVDSALNLDEDHLERLVEAVGAADPGGRLDLHGFVSPDRLKGRALSLLDRLPLSGVEVAINSTNPAALRHSGRATLDEARLEADLERLAAVTPVDLQLILGLPGDDLAGFRRTLDFAGRQLVRLGPERLPVITVFWLIAEPGSPFWRDRERLGLNLAAEGVPYVLDLGGFPTRDLVEAARAVQDHRVAERLRMDGPRQLLEGVVPPERMITSPAQAPPETGP